MDLQAYRLENEEVVGQTLAEEDDVRLDKSITVVVCAPHDLALSYTAGHDVLHRSMPLAVEAVCFAERSVSLNDHVLGYTGGGLERVDILRPYSLQQALPVQECQEVVRRCRLSVS